MKIIEAAAAIAVLIAIILYAAHRFLHNPGERTFKMREDEIEERTWHPRTPALTDTGEIRLEAYTREWWHDRAREIQRDTWLDEAYVQVSLDSGWYASTPWIRKVLM
jgi:hypothetical protein